MEKNTLRTFRSLFDNRDEHEALRVRIYQFNAFPNLLSWFFIFVIPVELEGIPHQNVVPHHLYNIFLKIIHPSQFTCRQKVNKHIFPIHVSSRVRREVVWDIFEQNISNHVSVHVGRLKSHKALYFTLPT